ncbi:Kinesin-like protein KLP2 [Gryllus bimaculatus]|nr:Kinesin-like protein KLP2 [Gryllus bimaculatus]
MKQTAPQGVAGLPPRITRPAEERLMVAVRIRPIKHNEGQRVLHMVDNKMVVLEDAEGDKNDVLRQKRGSERRYVYDVAFGEQSTQEEVYRGTTSRLVQDVLLGYNATVFAYGATGSGKTHTMVGSPQQPGIMVRALNDLFQHVRDARDPDEYQANNKFSCIKTKNAFLCFSDNWRYQLCTKDRASAEDFIFESSTSYALSG